MRMMLSNEAPGARPVRKFTIPNAQDWMQWSGVSLSDLVKVDETPGVKLGGVGFSRSEGRDHELRICLR